MGNAIDSEWSESPKFILRAACIADLTANWPAGEFAEFGVGTGTLTRSLVARGFHGSVYDLGEGTRVALRRDVLPPGGPVRVIDDPDDIPAGSVDYLLAFEVLEHIADEGEVLSTWARKLKPGGRVLISVPAHMRKFSATDRRVGHVRRYERGQLRDLLEGAGFGAVEIANYGFPLGNLSRRVMCLLERENGMNTDVDVQVGRSVRSGVEQPTPVNALARVLNKRTLAPFPAVQRRFLAQDRGDGYVAIARFGV